MIENRTFEKISFTDTVFEDEYYNCTFISCDFSNVIFRQTDFDRCTFSTCNLSMSKFKNALRNISFIDCKMTGVDFSEINRFSGDLIFENSHLDYGNSVAVKLQETIFRNCKMYETFFDNADIKNSIFEHCNLERASFAGTDLEKVDFSTAFNFSINPAACKLKKTVFSEDNLRGLVDHLNIIIK